MANVNKNVALFLLLTRSREHFQWPSGLYSWGFQEVTIVSTREAILIAATPANTDESTLHMVEDLVLEHTVLVFRIAYSALRNHHDAEDAAQEVFLRVLRHRKQLAKVDNRKSWLARIAWRVAVERRGARIQAEGAEMLENIPSQAASVIAALGDEQMQGMLAGFIDGLERDLREVITLSTVQELNSREIGAVLGIPEATVRTRQMRARQLLREKFAAALRRR